MYCVLYKFKLINVSVLYLHLYACPLAGKNGFRQLSEVKI